MLTMWAEQGITHSLTHTNTRKAFLPGGLIKPVVLLSGHVGAARHAVRRTAFAAFISWGGRRITVTAAAATRCHNVTPATNAVAGQNTELPLFFLPSNMSFASFTLAAMKLLPPASHQPARVGC